MKKCLFSLVLLFCGSASATKVSWTGDVDTGGDPQTVSGTFETDGKDILWTMDLNVDGRRYVFLPQYYQFQPGPLDMSDVPLVGDEEQDDAGDLQWLSSIGRWAFGRGQNNVEEIGGRIISFNYLDARPTPEPSTFVLLGSALLGLAGFRRIRRRNILSRTYN